MSEAEVPARRYITALTGMRGVAAFLVFLYHYEALHPGIRLDLAVPLIGPVLQFPLGFGSVGVDVFFVLSGFLLTLPFARSALEARPGPGLVRYFRRRFLRVFPAYYAQLLILLVVGSWFVTWRPLDTGALLAHLVMFFNIGPQPVSPMVGVWWTLPVEMGFYLLLPLLALFLRPKRWIPLVLVCVLLSVAYRAWAAAHFAPISDSRAFLAASQLPGNLAEFLAGASAALLVQYVAVRNLPKPSPLALDLMFAAGLIAPGLWLWNVVLAAGSAYWKGHWSMLIGPLALGLPLSVSVLSLYWGSRLGELLFANRVVYFLGLVSYSLYLWHFVAMQQLQKAIGDGYAGLSHWITFPVCVGAVVGVAALSYYLAERPFYRLRSYRQAVKADRGIPAPR